MMELDQTLSSGLEIRRDLVRKALLFPIRKTTWAGKIFLSLQFISTKIFYLHDYLSFCVMSTFKNNEKDNDLP